MNGSSKTCPLISLLLLFKIIGDISNVIGDHNNNLNEVDQVNHHRLKSTTTESSAVDLILNNESSKRVKRIIGSSTSKASDGDEGRSRSKGKKTFGSSSNNDAVRSSNYYQVDGAFPNEGDDGGGVGDDNNDDEEDDEQDKVNNLSEHEIQEIVEHDLIQNDLKKRPKGPPPFVNTLQSSSQEDFIVKEVDEPSIADVNGTHYNSTDIGSNISSNSQHHKRLVLLPISSSSTYSRHRKKNVIKRKKSSESAARFLNDNQHLTGTFNSDGTKLKCICDTKDCIANDMMEPTVCFTHGMCYTQYTDLEDGSRNVTKGCISGETPLLCESRRLYSSALLRNKRLPYLVCCKSHLCNAGELTTTRRTTSMVIQEVSSTTMMTPAAATATALVPLIPIWSPVNESTNRKGEEEDDDDDENFTETITETETSKGHVSNETLMYRNESSQLTKPNATLTPAPSSSRFISPLASSFLIGGAIIIVAISIVGFYILRREQQRFRVNSYRKQEQEQEEGQLQDGGVVENGITNSASPYLNGQHHGIREEGEEDICDSREEDFHHSSSSAALLNRNQATVLNQDLSCCQKSSSSHGNYSREKSTGESGSQKLAETNELLEQPSTTFIPAKSLSLPVYSEGSDSHSSPSHSIATNNLDECTTGFMSSTNNCKNGETGQNGTATNTSNTKTAVV